MEKENNKENSRKSVRSKYRTEYSGDHMFDYKDPASLTRFISDAGKLTPARISKLSISQQKKVANAVKKARTLALVPTGTHAYDTASKTELISPVPFEYQALIQPEIELGFNPFNFQYAKNTVLKIGAIGSYFCLLILITIHYCPFLKNQISIS